MDTILNKAKQAFDHGDNELGSKLIEDLLNNDSSNIEALMLKAKMFYQKQKWGDALNTLNKVNEINPNYEPALHYMHMINSILNFWNKDNFNP